MNEEFRKNKLGRYIRLIITIVVLVQYFVNEHGNWFTDKQLLTYLLFAIFSLFQFLYRNEENRYRVLIEMLLEGIVATVLYTIHVADDPNMIFLFLPLIFRCSRNLPVQIGLPSLFVISCFPVLGRWIAGFSIVSPFELLNPSWYLLFVPGWMIRREEEEVHRTKVLIKQIRKQQVDLKQAHTELIRYTLDAEENAVLRERTRVAGEIHDTVGHTLTSVIRGLDASLELLRTNQGEVEKYLLTMRGMAKDGLEDIRRSVRSMQDTENWFENREWETVLNRFAGQIKMTSGINIGFINTIDVPLSKRYSVYQCMKEAVTNAIRHGDATDIIIFQREHDGIVYIDISNNGKMPTDSIVKGVGLTNLINRMQSVGGHATFGVIDETFRVSLSWEVEEEKEVKEIK